MRLGIYGGSFDPVHHGHLLMAESFREQCALDQLWLIPASQPPHKQHRQLAPAKHRLEMLRLATSGHSAFVVSTIETSRDGISYTVDTLAEVAAQNADAELLLLIGSESLSALPTWRDPRGICELAIPAVVHRRGKEIDYSVLTNLVSPERLERIRTCQIDNPLIEISSTEIRRRVAAGQSIRYRTPRAVEKYIETHGLYRASD